MYHGTSNTEQKIARAILKAAKLSDLTMRIFDEEEFIVKTNNKVIAFAALGDSGQNEIIFFNNEGKRLGWLLLVWGNDFDLISDYTASEEMEKFLKPVNDKIDKWAEKAGY